jgi:MATE family multidrug resistance protein
VRTDQLSVFMSRWTPWRLETRETVRLGLPLAIAFAGAQGLGLVDTMVAGRLGPVPIAAVGLGNALYFAFLVIGVGILMGFDPIAAQAVGADDHAAARRGLNNAIAVSVLLTGPIMALAWHYSPQALDAVGATEPTIDAAMAYLLARLPGTLPSLMVVAQRGYLQAYDRTRPILVSVILINLVNIPASGYLGAGDDFLGWIGLDWQTGFAGMGVWGIGLASSIVATVQCVYFVWVIRGRPRPAGAVKATLRGIRRQLVIGTPIGVALVGEVGIFTVVSVLMARFSTVAVAGHQVALQLATFSFTFCLGISSATSVRVGQAIGRDDGLSARRAGLVGVSLGAGVMCLSASAFTLFPNALARWVTTDASVVAVAVPLLVIAGAFQIFDGIQAVMGGALRGLADTTFPMGAAIIGHWAIAMPIGCHLAFDRGMGPAGLWWGLTTGLAVVSVVVSIRFWIMSTRARALARG